MTKAYTRRNRFWIDFSEKNRIVAALGEMVEHLDDGEHLFYYITINFNMRPDCYQKQIIKMHKEVRHVYSWILRDAERKLWSPARAQFVPFLIAFVDLPEARYNSYVALSDHNEGFHVHCVLVIRKDTRKKDQWKAHIEKHRGRYYGQNGIIRKIHVIRIKRNIAKVVDYSAKLYKRSCLDEDSMLILHEVPSQKSGYVWGQASETIHVGDSGVYESDWKESQTHQSRGRAGTRAGNRNPSRIQL